MNAVGFRYQSGETGEIAAEIKKTGSACVEVGSQDELETVLENLEEYDLFLDDSIPLDTDALDIEEDPDFYARAFFNDETYIDFFRLDEEIDDFESGEDDLYWE